MKRVLIVEDDKVALALFAKIVRMVGAEVVSVRTAREGWDLVAGGGRFDLMILDLILPMESGWDLLAKIRGHPASAEVPVAVVTGADISEQERDRLLKRANAVVEKSMFDLQKFEELLRGFLGEGNDSTLPPKTE